MLKINKVSYRLYYRKSLVLTDGTVCLALVDHPNKIVYVSTGDGRRGELEILNSIIHEAVHALIRQDNRILNAKEGGIAEWVGFHISRLLYDNPDIFRPYLKTGNKKRALWRVSNTPPDEGGGGGAA